MSRAILIAIIGLFVGAIDARAASIVVTPVYLMQGDPALVSIEGVPYENIERLVWNNKILPVFEHEGEPAALIGVSLSEPTGISTITLTLKDGATVEKQAYIVPRKRTTAPLGIPAKMGGNTRVAGDNLMNMFAQENAILSSVISASKAFWTESFQYPLPDTTVSDAFGYVRQTGAHTVFHRGTDFHADIGTPVYALSDGVVRLMRQFTAYGKIVVIDYGSEISSYYLHLSQMNVRKGEIVKKGQVIGLSGDTGYALEPHLHLSVKIKGTSVDPMKFFALLGSGDK